MIAQLANRSNASGTQPLDTPQDASSGAQQDTQPLDTQQDTPQGASSGAQRWNLFPLAPQLAIPHNLPPHYLHDSGEPPSWRYIIAFLCTERYNAMQTAKSRAKVGVLIAILLALNRQQHALTAPTGLAGELCTLSTELIRIVAEETMEENRRVGEAAGL
jgi:hypothetical protein